MREIIEDAFFRRAELSQAEIETTVRPAVLAALDALESGAARVAEPGADGWRVNEWLKKAVLLYFRISQSRVTTAGHTAYFDKVPCRWAPGSWLRCTEKTRSALPWTSITASSATRGKSTLGWNSGGTSVGGRGSEWGLE